MATRNWKTLLATLAVLATVLAASEHPTATANTPPSTGPDFGTQRIGIITIPDDRNERWARFPEATGGVGEVTYKIVHRRYPLGDPLADFTFPHGLRVTQHNGDIYLEGQPQAPPGFYDLKYLATDEEGNTDSIDFTILIRTVPRFEHAAYTVTLYIDAFSAATLPEATYPDVGGFPTISLLSYQLRGLETLALIVNDLDFNPTTRVLSGTPHTLGSIRLTLVATNALGDLISTVITVNVENKLAPPTGLDITPYADRGAGSLSRTALLTWQGSENSNSDTVYDVYLAPPFKDRYVHPAPLPLGPQTATATSRVIELEGTHQYPAERGTPSLKASQSNKPRP